MKQLKHILTTLLVIYATISMAQTQPNRPTGATPYGSLWITPDGLVWTGSASVGYTAVGSKEDYEALINAGYSDAQIDSIATDVYNRARNRTNHTGTQEISTVNGLQNALNAKADKTTTVTGTDGLTGGGDLSANRTIGIANGGVTNARMANMANGTIKGRVSAGAGVPEDLSTAQVRSMLNINNVDNTSDANKPISTATATALGNKVDKTTTITGGGGIDVGGSLSSGSVSISANDTYFNNKYLRKDVDDNNGNKTLTVGKLVSPSAELEALKMESLATGTNADQIVVVDASGNIKKKPPTSDVNIGVANSGGTNQFSLGATDAIRFAGTGDASVSFNPATKTVTINSVPGSGTGGAVTSFNGRDGAVVATTGDYSTSQVTEGSNLYFTEGRVRSTVLTGLSTAGVTPVVATDNILQGIGKLQGQMNNRALASRNLTVSGTAGRIVASGGAQNLTADREWTLDLAPSGVTAGTYPKVTVDTYGRATAGSALAVADIPNLPTSKITSGTLDIARIPTGTTGSTVALGNHTHALGDLSNVSLTAPSNGQLLSYNGTNWVNSTVTIPTVNNGTLTMSGSNGLTGSATFTANQSGNSTFTVSPTYGTTAGTIAQGNDSRINNGQTAFSWGNPDGRFLPLSTTRYSGDPSDIKTYGVYAGGVLSGLPSGFSNYGTILSLQSGSDRFTQIYAENSSANKIAFRTGQGSTTTWQNWNEFWHSGNLANGTTSQYIRGDGSLATFPTIPGAQTLSLGSSAGNIAITEGNSVTINSLGLTVASTEFTDWFESLPAGMLPYAHYAGSTGFPAGTGAGVLVKRGNGSTSLGAFALNADATTSSKLKYNVGISSGGGWSGWNTFASEEWANAQGWLKSADLSGFVPYTGATSAVNLGNNSFTTGSWASFAGGATTIASNGNVTATSFVGPLTGNATTATTLQTARTIAISGGATGTATSFNGSANITIPVTGLNADNLNAGTVPIARIPTGTTGSTVALGNHTHTQYVAKAGDAMSGRLSFSGTGANSGIGFVSGANISSPTGTEIAYHATGGHSFTGGAVKIGDVAGTGDRMMVAGADGTVKTQALPSAVSQATATVSGTIKLQSNTEQPASAMPVTTNVGRTYGIQLNNQGQAVVNVPWTDNNTTYTAGNGLTLTGTTFSLPVSSSGSGVVTDVAQTSTGISVTKGNVPFANLPTGTTASTVAVGNHTHTFASITGKPTTASGYGITDAVVTGSTPQTINGIKTFAGTIEVTGNLLALSGSNVSIPNAVNDDQAVNLGQLKGLVPSTPDHTSFISRAISLNANPLQTIYLGSPWYNSTVTNALAFTGQYSLSEVGATAVVEYSLSYFNPAQLTLTAYFGYSSAPTNPEVLFEDVISEGSGSSGVMLKVKHTLIRTSTTAVEVTTETDFGSRDGLSSNHHRSSVTVNTYAISGTNIPIFLKAQNTHASNNAVINLSPVTVTVKKPLLYYNQQEDGSEM